MELHRQTCLACGSRTHHLVLRRDETHRTTVYVGCAECEKLVARYDLATYYHHGKGFESWLQRFAGYRDSGRNMAGDFKKAEQTAVAEYEEVREELRKQGKEL